MQQIVDFLFPHVVLEPTSVGDWCQTVAAIVLVTAFTVWLFGYSLRRPMPWLWSFLMGLAWLTLGIGSFGRGDGIWGLLYLVVFFSDFATGRRRLKSWLDDQEANAKARVRVVQPRPIADPLPGFNVPPARPRRPARPLTDSELRQIANAVARRARR